ncbi:MAG: hypothetical protein K1X75_14905 [Leptospirales bacterium]|nr:hypothetical protein [Leptospirales bacterium]
MELIAEGEAYTPGASVINENEILDRMERELGEQRPARSAPVAPTEQSASAALPAALPELPAQIELAGGAVRTGILRLPGRYLELRSLEDGESLRIEVQQIAELEFQDWAAAGDLRTAEGVRTLFFPIRCRLRLSDGRELIGRLNPYLWLRLRFQEGSGAVALYTFWSGLPPAAGGADSAMQSAASAAVQPPPMVVRRIQLGVDANRGLPQAEHP